MNRFQKKDKREASTEVDSPRPLREYSTGSAGTSPSMQWFRFEVTAYWLLPLVIFIVILGGGIYAVWKFDIFSLGSGEASASVPYLDPSGDILVPELMESYLTAAGGREALNSIRSVRYKGRIVESMGEINFQILVSLPDKGMIITDPGKEISQKLVLNGDTAWQESMRGMGEPKITRLGEEDTNSLKWSLRVHNTFRGHALEGRIDAFSGRKIEFQGRPCYELTKVMPDDSRFIAVLDAATLYLVKSVETTYRGGAPERLEVLYEDHRKVSSGIVEAYQTKTYKKGELYNEVFLDYIEINPGLISSLFEVPDELTP